MTRPAAGGIDAEMNMVLEECMQKIRRLAEAHVAASGVELCARERALDERERQLNEREQALDERAKMMQRPEVVEQEFSQALKHVDLGTAEQEQAMFKNTKGLLSPAHNVQPEKAKAALMVPSPTRARNHSIPAKDHGSGAVAPLRPVMRSAQFAAFSPRTSASPPAMPCSPPVSMGCSPPVATAVASPSPVSTENGNGRKMSMINERKEKLLMALTSTLAGAPGTGDESGIMNASLMSTPGRCRADSGIAGKTKDRRSLAELLQEDEARLSELRPAR